MGEGGWTSLGKLEHNNKVSKMKPKDPMWNFFSILEDKKSARCKDCNTEVSAKVNQKAIPIINLHVPLNSSNVH